MAKNESPATDAIADEPAAIVLDAPPSYDGWEMDEQLQHIERVLQTAKMKNRETEALYRREAMRFDQPHAGPSAGHIPTMSPPKKQRRAVRRGRGFGASLLMWIALSLGTSAFVCGGILLGWSLATGRQELWSIGLPMTLVGEIALLASLLLQLDRLGHDNREAAVKLDDVSQQLHELKTTTTLLGTSQSPASSTFYSHFVGGAGPQLLLTDLKSQIDLLAVKISQDQR